MVVPAARWHRDRHENILARHPEIRRLQGHFRGSQFVIGALVCLSFVLAWGASRLSWPMLLLASFVVGAFVSHALGVLIHEATHNLVARTSLANRLWILVANLPLVAPAGIEFRAQHLLHHKYLGEVDGRDTQAPTRAEIAFVGDSLWRKFASFTVGRFFYKSRPANHVPADAFLIANWAVQIVATGLVLWLFGVKAVVFLTVSALLAFGPHPVGARRLSEHFPVVKEQPTVSYYGVLNPLSLNVGFHVEHHDFPAVAWIHLPALRETAREDYEPLFAFHSWTGLLLRYFGDPRLRVEHYVGFGPALRETEPAVPQDHPHHAV